MFAIRFAIWWAMFLLRALCCLAFAERGAHGDLGCAIWAAIEVHALVLAAWNEGAKRGSDESWGAVVVPLLYLAGVVVVPVGESSAAGQGAIVASALLVFCVRLHLGKSYSVGGSTWVGLVESGPYRFVRHPMLAAQILVRAAVAIEYPTAWNLAAVAIFGGCMMVAVIVEEKFLQGMEEYRSYCGRVPYRLFPLVW